MTKFVDSYEDEKCSVISFLGLKIKTKKQWFPKWYNKYYNFFKKLDKYIPKKKNKIIFCSWPDFSDNAKEFYEFINKYHSNEYEIIWTYRDNSDYQYLKNRLKCKLIYHFSLECLYHTFTSKYIVVTHDDMFCYDYKEHEILCLFHGMPVKTVGLAEKNITDKRLKNYSNLGEYANLFATSDIFKLSLAYCFRAYPQNIHITGQARTDCIFYPSENSKNYISKFKENFEKIILYTPTYKEMKIGTKREIKKEFNNIFYLDDYDEQNFYNYLKENNILFLMKPHPQDEFFYRDYLRKNKIPANIKIIFDKDLKDNDFYFYEIFSYCDLMIGDYSSIAVDWLILEKPAIYLSTVVDEYIKSRGMCLEDNYQMLLPGPKVNNYKDLIIHIDEYIKAPFIFKNQYDRDLKLLHKYFDGDSSKRIYEIMEKL